MAFIGVIGLVVLIIMVQVIAGFYYALYKMIFKRDSE